MPPNPSSASIAALIASKRAMLDRLEAFARTPDFGLLLGIVQSGGETDSWLADWLIRPAFGLGACPIDIATQPGGMDLLVDQLTRIANGSHS